MAASLSLLLHCRSSCISQRSNSRSGQLTAHVTGGSITFYHLVFHASLEWDIRQSSWLLVWCHERTTHKVHQCRRRHPLKPHLGVAHNTYIDSGHVTIPAHCTNNCYFVITFWPISNKLHNCVTNELLKVTYNIYCFRIKKYTDWKLYILLLI